MSDVLPVLCMSHPVALCRLICSACSGQDCAWLVGALLLFASRFVGPAVCLHVTKAGELLAAVGMLPWQIGSGCWQQCSYVGLGCKELQQSVFMVSGSLLTP
jgi:hypothetical protein